MPVVNPIIFKVTEAGRDAAAYAFNNLPSGKLSLTTIKVGLAKYSTVGNETALQNPLPNTFSIGGGGVQAGSGQIRFTPILASTTRIEAFEIGLFTDTGILFAIAATPSNTPLLVIEPDIEAIFSMNVALTNVDPDSIEIVVDVNAPLAVVMMGQHLAAAHPHSQYKRTNDASERLKVADGQSNDEAISKGQLNSEATTRAGVDSALSGQIAQEVLDRQAGDTAEATARENGDLALAVALAAEITNRENAVAQVNFAVFDNEATYNAIGTHTFTVPANVNRVIVELQAPGGGGGQGGGNDGGAEIGGGGGAGASGQWLSVLIFNLMAGDEIVITIGAKGLGGHSGSTPATAGGDVSFSVTGRANSLIVAKGGRAGAKGSPGDDNGSNPSYRGQGGALWGSTSLKMRFCTRVADVYEESGIGGIQTIHGGKGGDSLFGEGGEGGLGYSGLAAQAGEDGTLGSGGGGGGGQGGTGGGVGGDGGEGFAKVYW